jgi:hypothetical protein
MIWNFDEFCGILWNSMDFYGIQWISVEFCYFIKLFNEINKKYSYIS